MKNYLALLISVVLFFSCIRDPSDNIAVSQTTIFNNSGHNIEMQLFRNGELETVVTITNNKTKEYFRPDDDLPPFSADSVWIIYFNKASIMHTKDVTSPVSRSLMLEDSYEGGKTGDKTYEFTYTFTPDDYEEALEFGD